jgi:hypothetical protein
MMLDHAVSGALLRLRALERALHSSDQWSIAIGEYECRAQRFVCDDRILFRATFPATRYPADAVAELRCGWDTVLLRPAGVEEVEPDSFDVDWELRIADSVAA